jgi:hypothetical protein
MSGARRARDANLHLFMVGKIPIHRVEKPTINHGAYFKTSGIAAMRWVQADAEHLFEHIDEVSTTCKVNRGMSQPTCIVNYHITIKKRQRGIYQIYQLAMAGFVFLCPAKCKRMAILVIIRRHVMETKPWLKAPKPESGSESGISL